MPDPNVQEVAELRRTLAREVRARQAAEATEKLVKGRLARVEHDLYTLRNEKSDSVLEGALRRAEERIAEVDRELMRTDRRRLAVEAELNRLKLRQLQPETQAAPVAEEPKPAAAHLSLVPPTETAAPASIGQALTSCAACDGCGQVADDEDRTPWTAWAHLPPGSDLAVRLGIVKPVQCETCGGTGKATP